MSTQDDIKAISELVDQYKAARQRSAQNYGEEGIGEIYADQIMPKLDDMFATLTRKDEEIAAKDALIAELAAAGAGYMAAVASMQDALNSPAGNVHGALSALVGATDNLECAISSAKEQSNG